MSLKVNNLCSNQTLICDFLLVIDCHLNFIYRRRDDFKKSPARGLPVHLDQLRAQRSVTSMGELYL